jgi:polyisoprenoid-binding protein YceI
MYDGTLPSEDWFDIKNHPKATFQSQSFKKTDTGFSVTGILSIKDVKDEITFEFQLDGDTPTMMEALLPINRLKYNIGKKSDADAEWVSEIIKVNIKVVATAI